MKTDILELLTIAELAENCQIETEKSRKNQPHTPCYCLELFRRGIIDKNQIAWHAVENQYHRLIQSCIGKHVNQEDLIQEVWYRLIRKFTQEGPPDFSDLRNLHAYISRISINIVIDDGRKHEREERRIPQLTQEIQSRTQTDEEAKIDMQDLKAYIREKLTEPMEKSLFQLIFEFGLSPQQIVEQHPYICPSIKEINKIRERIVKRLRRDPNVRRYFEDV
ncbi:sigma-70 family RNA polymerase sigma factor [Chloroflexi bacterium TSY]|nr:sigma-70 family RNA polymerase sigma factor [Chloroflexi bacterium TSY]